MTIHQYFCVVCQVSERDLRLTFLPAFKACVDAGTYSIMCSYNRYMFTAFLHLVTYLIKNTI